MFEYLTFFNVAIDDNTDLENYSLQLVRLWMCVSVCVCAFVRGNTCLAFYQNLSIVN